MILKSLLQLAEDMFDPMRFDVGSAFAKAREYVQRFMLNEQLHCSPSFPFDVELAFDDAIESLQFDLLDVANKQEPSLRHDNGEWDDVDSQIEKLLTLLNSRREEIEMAVEEEIADSKRR